MKAIGRSIALAKGLAWRMFWTIVPLYIAIAIIQLIIVGTLQAAGGQGFIEAARTGGQHVTPFWIIVVQTVVSAIFSPFAPSAVVLLYYDARVRKEGFDLMMLAEQLDSGGHPGLTFGETTHPQERDESWRTNEPEKPDVSPSVAPVDTASGNSALTFADAADPPPTDIAPTEPPNDEPS